MDVLAFNLIFVQGTKVITQFIKLERLNYIYIKPRLQMKAHLNDLDTRQRGDVCHPTETFHSHLVVGLH